MKHKLKTPPKFSSEAAERAFWASHDSAEYVDWSAAKRALGQAKAIDRNHFIATAEISAG